MFVEELEQKQLNNLKEIIFWNNTGTKFADFGNITQQEKSEIDNALFENDIENKTIYKLFRDIYFDKDFTASIELKDGYAVCDSTLEF